MTLWAKPTHAQPGDSGETLRATRRAWPSRAVTTRDGPTIHDRRNPDALPWIPSGQPPDPSRESGTITDGRSALRPLVGQFGPKPLDPVPGQLDRAGRRRDADRR